MGGKEVIAFAKVTVFVSLPSCLCAYSRKYANCQLLQICGIVFISSIHQIYRPLLLYQYMICMMKQADNYLNISKVVSCVCLSIWNYMPGFVQFLEAATMLCVHCARRLLSPSSNSNFGLKIHLEHPDQRLQTGAFVVCFGPYHGHSIPTFCIFLSFS